MKRGKAIATEQALPDRGSALTAALELLDSAGLDACTLPALAGALGIDADEIRLLFADEDALNLAMAGAMIDHASVAPSSEGWRARLASRAMVARAAMLSRRDGGLLFSRLGAPFPIEVEAFECVSNLCGAGFSLADARAAVLVVDRFALGSALAEQAMPSGADAGGQAFAGQVNILLAGIDASRTSGLAMPADRRQGSFQHKVWVFLRDARESANIAFARTAHVNELDRRILLLLLAQGDLTLAAISTANGVDKAQVSRAIKRMTEVSLLVRGGIRSPIKLSQSGRHLAEKLQRQAELRNRELSFGISDEQLLDLFGALDSLLGRAMALFEQERKWSAANQPRNEKVDFQDLVDEGLPGENGVVVDRSRILPPFVTLCSYMLRGGALSHKRRTGLSNFESWVMTEVWRNPPISWPQLVLALYRDQSQAGRTINYLIDIGLVERTGKPGRRHGFFAPTEEGRRIADIINETAEKRSDYLFQGIPARQLDNFMNAFDILSRNAEVQLARERAILDMERT